MTPKQAKAELARRELARRRLLFFTQQTQPNYMAGWVHDDICRRLERFSHDVAEKKSPRLMLLVPPRHGKLLSDSIQVLTSNRGWTTHGALRPGDFVFTPLGEPTEVLAVSKPSLATYEVETTDGEVLKCHANHEWRLYNRYTKKWGIYETHELVDKPLYRDDRALLKFQNIDALQFPRAEQPVEPYLFGAWLGDGDSLGARIYHAASDEAYIQAATCSATPVTSQSTHKTTGVICSSIGGLIAPLRALGVLNNKHIPDVYKYSSVEQRLKLLAGLIDTDGHVEAPTSRVRIATVSDRLAEDIEEVVRSLGWRVGRYTQQPCTSTSGIVGRRPVHYVAFQPGCDIPTALPRKKILRPLLNRTLRAIRSVRLAWNPEPGRCIQVDSPDGLYLVGKRLVPTHNSTLASISFPSWHLGHYPKHDVVNASYNVELPMKFSRQVRELFRSKFFNAMFPQAALSEQSQSVESWMTTEGGSFTAVGVGGGLTGKGAHVLTIDDPIKNMEEADSILTRDNLWDWYHSVAYTRLAPGGGVLLIETWWSDDDLAGRLQRLMQAGDPYADQFDIVKYPALSDSYEYRSKKTLKIDTFPHPVEDDDMELMRAPGQALHPDRYDVEALKRIKANVSPRVWSALYQQNPVPDEGVYFKQEYFRYEKAPPQPRGLRIMTAWDFAIGVKQANDWTVGATAMQDTADVLHVCEVNRFRGDSFYIVEQMLDTAATYKDYSYTIGVEDGQIWKSIRPLLEKRMAERKLYPPIEVMKPLTDKLARARPLQGRMQQGRVVFSEEAPWCRTVTSELLRFPAGVHDDCVDALSWLVHMAVHQPAPQSRKPKPPASWKDKLRSSPRGGVGHMAA